ncbi:YadA C-terminal domain-containing protein [Enterobacteriaceae bacterium H11S18]|nr:YadA C-terminal domain-containing protein [Dryocola clanedunensis]MCT4704535.1 YadA C-terminal domain-containing protein [Dryocola clanedunensis]MCT4710667.1 YadA C-terminal domain-containing protein [Dryocola clanedunensis]
MKRNKIALAIFAMVTGSTSIQAAQNDFNNTAPYSYGGQHYGTIKEFSQANQVSGQPHYATLTDLISAAQKGDDVANVQVNKLIASNPSFIANISDSQIKDYLIQKESNLIAEGEKKQAELARQTREQANATHLDTAQHYVSEPGAHLDGQHVTIEPGSHLDAAQHETIVSGAHLDNNIDSQQKATHLDNNVDSQLKATHLDTAYHVVSEPGAHLDNNVDSQQKATHLDNNVDSQLKATHLDTAYHVISEPGAHLDNNVDSQQKATHLDNSVDSQLKATHLDTAYHIVSEPGAHLDNNVDSQQKATHLDNNVDSQLKATHLDNNIDSQLKAVHLDAPATIDRTGAKISALNDAMSVNTKAIANEATARTSDEAVLANGVSTNAKTVADEATTRKNEDTLLAQGVSANAKTAADEANARKSGDIVLAQGVKEAETTGEYAQSRADTAFAHAEANKQALAATNHRLATDDAELANHEQRIGTLESQTTSNFAKLKSQVDDNRKRASAGISGVAAMANIPQVTNTQDFSVGAGVGTADSESALAVGFSARATDNVVVKASVSDDSQHNFVAGAGVSYGW